MDAATTVQSPSPIDKHVGSRMRHRRLLIGMSQERLGELVGITFQQVQKYEKGTNRVSASRLHQVARVLGVEISYFFAEQPLLGGPDPEAVAIVETFLAAREGIELAKAFVAVSDPSVRRAVLELVRAAAERKPIVSERRSPAPKSRARLQASARKP